ncbi:hypothetical protein [Streptomyces clavuligerus]|uniref:Uncharacterized protein n=2 Tax=Streptomyces clavuligerus TaxID=1901 RepID=E2Q5W5_STRCL|nr:hypothetical protein [Streptomyces clavuligerus]ANW21688.1 hypothetical protein BB341_27480 [Streptomyces clavuligerus]AXU16317.1 hypothetical protein D1794_28550 [Streptomyces clavuligerus]EFG05125.1 Hypothetical protein SCLAV_0049 [Streptomyces clavuligerus]MBY6306478.1 hypothetical protein [Streptomyces clavuligerus]QCS09097.1 hypothetical protein CRV15_27910 [Streptomyces clavuligerus]
MSGNEYGSAAGFEAPPLRRLRYFHGQMLGARDFQREQDYFREKLRLRLRCLLGYGVVCGLFVRPVPPDGDDCAESAEPPPPQTAGDTAQQADQAAGRPRRARVRITPGLAVDCDGDEVVVRGGCTVDLWKALPPQERDTDTVWIGIEYAERTVEPTRAVYEDGCAESPDCEFGWTEECYAIRVTGCEPPEDERCESCCSRCRHRVLWLARIDRVDWHRPVREEQIRMDVRRSFGRRVPTVITGLSWRHGHTYTIEEAKALLGTVDEDGGLVVRFSDEVRTDSLLPGVVDIQVIEGGPGRNASTWFMGGEFAEPCGDGEFTTSFRYRQNTRETLQDGDRVLITVRTAFLLDRCCHPVDGTHVGGKVPLIGCGDGDGGGDETAARGGHVPHRGCALPPSGVGPWTSGSGAGGDTFESWFFVKEC